MANLEPVLGSDDTIRRNFSKLDELFGQLQSARDRLDALEAGTPIPKPQFVASLAASGTANGLTASAFSVVSLDTATYDPDSMIDLANDRVTINRAGMWLITGKCLTTANLADGNFTELSWGLAGSNQFTFASPGPQGAAGVFTTAGSVPLRLSNGDVIDMRFFHNNATAKTAAAGCYFRGIWLSD